MQAFKVAMWTEIWWTKINKVACVMKFSPGQVTSRIKDVVPHVDNKVLLGHHVITAIQPLATRVDYDQGGDSISHKTSYFKISQSLEGARSVVRIIQLLRHLAAASAALLPRRLQNFKAIKHFNTRSCAFETLRDLTIRSLMRYWIGPQTSIWLTILSW